MIRMSRVRWAAGQLNRIEPLVKGMSKEERLLCKLWLDAFSVLENCEESAEKIRGKVDKETRGRLIPLDQFVQTYIPFKSYLNEVGPMYSLPESSEDFINSYKFSVINDYRNYVERETTMNDPSRLC